MTDPDTFHFNESLVRQLIERIEMNYERAVRRGDEDPIVLVLELLDPIACVIVERCGAGERIAGTIAEAKIRRATPAVVIGLPAEAANSITHGLVHDFAASLARMPAGEGFPVAVVSRVGASLYRMPTVPD